MIDAAYAEKLTDEELVSLTLDNQDYFLFLINRYKTKLFNYIRRITNVSPDDVEDLLQEVFLKVYLNLNDFDTSLKFSTWVYSITRNQVISNHRKLQVRAEGHSVEIDELARNIMSDSNIEGGIDHDYMKDNISKVLNKIDKKYREVLILKYLEEKSYDEISVIIRKPSGTVGSLINRAKIEFKKELSKQEIKF